MKALGNRVIIKPDPVEQKSDGGIILHTDAQIGSERQLTTTGIVIDHGPAAWLDPAMGGEPWVEKGARVVYAKYSGKFFTNPEDGEEYVCVNDDAIQVEIA